jgi:hypothetical protein
MAGLFLRRAATARWLPARSRLRRVALRRWLWAGAALLLLGTAVAAADLLTLYLPAAGALQDGEAALTQVREALGSGIDSFDAAGRDRVEGLLNRATEDFGRRSAIVQSGLLARFGSHVPFLGDQVRAAQALRATGAAASSLGLDTVALLRGLITIPSGTAAPALARLTHIAEHAGPAVDRVLADLDAVDAAFATVPPDARLIGPLNTARTRIAALLPGLDAGVRPAIELLRALPAAVGQGRHRYLLLLDNPGEQRPGGGFIGAVGEVTISEGVVTARTFRSSDFANALVTSVPAPRALDDTLFRGHPQELSDSNWSPDFPTSAAAAAHIYQLATGAAVDGVIGVDPIALSYVLRVTGPVPAPPYPQVVSADNALLQLNEIINQARPGDPGKAYLAPFGEAVLDRILSAPLSEDSQLAAALVRGAREKHIVMSFNDPALMAQADAAGVTGRVTDPASDALQVVDANVGGNKADLFVGRRYDLVANVGADGQVQDTLTLTYSNLAQSSPNLASLVTQYAGEYRDYVRVYLPETASLGAMTLRLGTTSSSVSPESVDFELHRAAVGYLLVVPAGQTLTLTIAYAGPFVDAGTQPAQYTLAWAKEIGAPGWPVSITVKAGGGEEHLIGDLTVDRSWTVAAG